MKLIGIAVLPRSLCPLCLVVRRSPPHEDLTFFVLALAQFNGVPTLRGVLLSKLNGRTQIRASCAGVVVLSWLVATFTVAHRRNLL